MNEKSKSIKLINWIKENRKSFFSILITVLVIVALVIFVYARIQVINSAASDKLDMATKIISQGDMKKGLEAIDDVINTYKNSPSAYRAMIMKASYFINEKRYEEAEQILKFYIANAKPKIVRPLGYPLLVTVYDDSNNIEQAISTSQEFLAKYSDSYLAPYVMENMARLYELSSKQEEANKVYKDIVDKFPQTVYANRASKKLK